MTKVTSLDELWESTPPSQRTFELDQLAGLPDAARRYFEDARAPGTSLAGKFSEWRSMMPGTVKNLCIPVKISGETFKNAQSYLLDAA